MRYLAQSIGFQMQNILQYINCDYKCEKNSDDIKKKLQHKALENLKCYQCSDMFQDNNAIQHHMAI